MAYLVEYPVECFGSSELQLPAICQVSSDGLATRQPVLDYVVQFRWAGDGVRASAPPQARIPDSVQGRHCDQSTLVCGTVVWKLTLLTLRI